MPTLLAVLIRLAAKAERGGLTAVRKRLVRSLAVLYIILILTTVALALGTAALAVALADWIGLVPALLSIAAVATITALILALTINTNAQRPTTTGVGLLGLSGLQPPRVDSLTVVVAALAVGLLLGGRRR
jgi:hypothetical protein